jgi:hypothetical protein
MTLMLGLGAALPAGV